MLRSSLGMNTDLAGITQELNARSFRTFEFFALAAVIYYLIAKAVTLAARAFAWRMPSNRTASSGS